ncbi:MAG: exosortase E/protease (VPEID-CTERM system) [Lentisphaeria bacterium]|jgi:exosortase E/protease (VPEID-CTERM system)
MLGFPQSLSSIPQSYRFIFLGLLLVTQLLLISFNFDAHQPRFLNHSGFALLAYAGHFAKFSIVALTLSLLLLWKKIPTYIQSPLFESKQRLSWLQFVGVELLAYTVFFILSALIFDQTTDSAPSVAISVSLIVFWLAALLSTLIFWAMCFAPLPFWLHFFTSEKATLAIAGGAGLFTLLLTYFAQQLWNPLSGATFQLSAFFLGLIYPDIVVLPELKILGTETFKVNIAPACSGYEGMGLITVFTALYLSAYRSGFRFPQAFLLFPIGIVIIWVLNALRISLLIAIGNSFSEDVAIGGFHSQAGWITFIVSTIGILALAHKHPLFGIENSRSSLPAIDPLAAPTIAPIIALLASTLITSAFTSQVDWLYPLRVIATGTVIYFSWRHYSFKPFSFNPLAICVGLGVFFLWVALVPSDESQNILVASTISESSRPVVLSWVIFRVVGASITVAIAEELMFRGYLFSKLSGLPVTLNGTITRPIFALTVSSIVFGAMHGEWFAGIIAGLAYGALRLKTGTVLDAIIAHGTTNLCLSAYVLTTGNWSLW